MGSRSPRRSVGEPVGELVNNRAYGLNRENYAVNRGMQSYHL